MVISFLFQKMVLVMNEARMVRLPMVLWGTCLF